MQIALVSIRKKFKLCFEQKRNNMSDPLPLWLLACQPPKLKFPKTLIAFC